MGREGSPRWLSWLSSFVMYAVVVAFSVGLLRRVVTESLTLFVAGWTMVGFAAAMILVCAVLTPGSAPFVTSGKTVMASSGLFGLLLVVLAAGMFVVLAGADLTSAVWSGRNSPEGWFLGAVVLVGCGAALLLAPQRVTLSRDGITCRVGVVSRSMRWDEVDVVRSDQGDMKVRVLAADGRAITVAVGVLPLSDATLAGALTHYVEDAEHRREIGTAESLRRLVDPPRVPGGARRRTGGRRRRA